MTKTQLVQVFLILITQTYTLDLCSFCVFKQYRVGPKHTICAANGKTYKNGCFAWCNKTRVVHPGACNVNHNPCDCPTGGDNYKPVCNFRGESYDNACIAKCYGFDDSNSDFCFVSKMTDNRGNNHFADMEGKMGLQVREDPQFKKRELLNQFPKGLPLKRWPKGYHGVNRVDKYNDRHSAHYDGLLENPGRNPGLITQQSQQLSGMGN